MLCFIGCQNTEKTELIMTYEDKQFYFTLDKGNDMEKYVYEKIKEDGSINLSGIIYNEDFKQLYIPLTYTITANTFGLSGNEKTYEAGDIVISFNGGYCYLNFLYEQTNRRNVQKVGEIEKSSLDGFRSLCNGFTNLDSIEVTFTLKPEPSESILKKIIVIIVVVISLTLFYIIYLLIQF